MNTTHRLQAIYRAVLGVVLFSVFALSPAHAETVNCTAITSLPYVISTQGVYCLTGNLGTSITSGDAITINANNVTIDMNGFKLGGLAAGDGTQAVGIRANQRKNITIKNGIIRGFAGGILLDDILPYTTSTGHVVRDILADQNTIVGIQVVGRGMTLHRNRVVDTGGSTVAPDSVFAGILVAGPANNILDNQVSTTTSTTSKDAIGIFVDDADNSILENNRLSETVASGTGASVGIFIQDSNDVIIKDNLITSADFGIFYTGGSSGLYGGNYTSNVTTPFTGGTAAGSTNYTNP